MNQQKKWRRRGLLILISILSVFVLVGCNSNSNSKEEPQPLPAGFDQAKVEEAGKKVIDFVNAKDNQALRDMGTEEIKKSLSDQALQPIHDKIEKLGTFNGIEKSRTVGIKDKYGNDYGAYVARAGYGDKKKSIVYTVTFNKEMKFVGLFEK